jgi:hypothetical protein
VATDLRLRPRGHWDQLVWIGTDVKFLST